MKNKEFYKLLKKNKSKSNSGFTLTELLVGLIMSIFVVGALGFGLMQMLRVTQKGNSETLVRNESSRALDFISDEMRRANAIEVDMATGSGSNIESVASDYTVPTGGTVRLALQIPGVDQRVIYSVAPPESSSPWKGPRVIYRWGPELTADGSYSTTGAKRVDNPAGWTNEALVDGISDVAQTVDCDNDGTDETTYQGFLACVEDDGSGQAITAQLYFTGETKGADGITTGTYSADTKTVARARTAPGNNSENLNSYTMKYKTLGAVYGCEPTSGSEWTMRTDFISDSSNPNDENGNKNKKWVHKPNRQPQPIKIDTSKNLDILSVPIESDGCISRGGDKAVNQITYTNTNLGEQDSVYEQDANGDYAIKSDVHVVKHTVDFDDPATYNGYDTDNIQVGDGTVVFLRKGSIVPGNAGYDPDGDETNNSTSSNDQRSLGEFLADPDPTVTGETVYAKKVGDNYEIINIGDDERIVAFEVGQESTATSAPGFDLQDNIFILTSDVFSNQETDSTP